MKNFRKRSKILAFLVMTAMLVPSQPLWAGEKDAPRSQEALSNPQTPITKEQQRYMRRWDPFLTLHNMQANMDRLFSDFDTMKSARSREDVYYMSMDIAQTPEGVEISAEIPGMDEKDVEILVSDDLLTISGEKKLAKEDEGKDYRVSERSFGQFSRTISLPRGADIEKITATFRNGILKIKVPLTEDAKAKPRKIEIRKE